MTEEPLVRSRILWMPKHGSTQSEYEDAFAVQSSPALPFLAAIADGATESAFARAWAETLVAGWAQTDLAEPDAFLCALAEWQASWQAEADTRTSDLPWYAAAKAEEGAFATFLGLVIQPEGTWHALAVGDCCLLHLTADGARTTWPMQHPEQFNNTPGLISSVPARPMGALLQAGGQWGRGDAFVLVTDAAAAWLMGLNSSAIPALSDGSFSERIHAARDAHSIRNDDVTVVLLEIG